MKKLATMFIVLLMIGAVPGWCLVGVVDNYVDNHTKDSRLAPVRDTGRIYGTVNHQIGTAMDKVPVIQSRNVIMEPISKFAGSTADFSRSLINGVWDIVTFKSFREKKIEKTEKT